MCERVRLNPSSLPLALSRFVRLSTRALKPAPASAPTPAPNSCAKACAHEEGIACGRGCAQESRNGHACAIGCCLPSADGGVGAAQLFGGGRGVGRWPARRPAY
eukprot:4780736-Pleurochrysis_carterae.AAC.1